MSKVVIFGIADTAQSARFYLRNDSEHEEVAFSVSEEYLPECDDFDGLLVVPFETVEHPYSPDQFRFFAPMTGRSMNRLRASVYDKIKDKGLELISYVSSRATIFPGIQIGVNRSIFETGSFFDAPSYDLCGRQ